MTITISPAVEAKARQNAQAEGISVEAYVEHLIQEDREWAEVSDESGAEEEAAFIGTRSAIEEALEQVERGEGKPAEQVFSELRARYGIPR